MAIINGTGAGETLNGTAGDDEIHGLGGNDSIRGLDGNDALYGDDGDDFLSGGFGNDRIYGGTGIGDRAGYANVIGGVTVDLRLQGTAQDTGSQGVDTLVGIEFLSGSNFNDTLIGDASDNFLWGVLGNDTISGNEGNDLIVAGMGNHQLDGGSGVDTWSVYGNGFDVTRGVTLSLIEQGGAQDTGQGLVTATNFENLNGSLFNDTLIGDGGANLLAGAAGDDRLVGGEGNDVLLGDGLVGVLGPIFLFTHMGFVTHGNDVLEGGEGHDTLIGGEGDDVMSGGGGHDRFIFGADILGFVFASGHDRITDFQKKDVLEFNFEGVDGLSDLVITEQGSDVLISWGDGANSVTLEDFHAKHLAAANFDFGSSAAGDAQPHHIIGIGRAFAGSGEVDFWLP